MKKIILSIILFIMFIPIFVNAKTCNTNNIKISSIIVDSKSDNVMELNKATADNKKLNLNLSMSDVGDTIKYKIVIKNDSNEDYEFNKNSLSINSNYIDYTLESEDDTNVIKANSSKVVCLKINYKKEVPDDYLESGIFNDNKSMTVFLHPENIIKNPNTGVKSFVLILFIIIISYTTYLLFKKKKYYNFMILLTGIVIIIPMSVYALCKCNIEIKSNIKIEKPEYYVYGHFELDGLTKIGTTIESKYTIYNSYRKLINDTGQNIFIRLKMKSSPRYCINDHEEGSLCNDYDYGYETEEECINIIKNAHQEDNAFCELKKFN